MRIDLTKRLSHKELITPLSEYTTPSEYSFTIDHTVQEVLHTLQSKMTQKHNDYFYITDKDNVLQGIITTRDLIYASPKTKLIDVVDTEVLKVHEEDKLEKALKLLTKHQILVLPIVNKENRFVGVLEVLPHDTQSLYKSKRLHQKYLKADLFQFIGFSLEQGKLNSTWMAFRYRMPWLFCNLIGGLICAVIAEFFQLTLVAFVTLALFIPLVLTLSESISIQSMTLSLRFLHLRKIQATQVMRRMLIEWKASALLALASCLVITLFYFAWSVEIKPIFAITVSMFVAMVISASFGALFPILLHIVKLDPKVAAGPVVLMVADIVTVSIYLSISTWMLMQ